MKAITLDLNKQDIKNLITEINPGITQTERMLDMCLDQVQGFLQGPGGCTWEDRKVLTVPFEGETTDKFRLSNERNPKYRMATLLRLVPSDEGVSLEESGRLILDYVSRLVETFLLYYTLGLEDWQRNRGF